MCSKSFKQRIDGWRGWSKESWRIQGKTNRKSDASYTRTWCKRDRRLHPGPRLKEIRELEELECQMDSGKDAEWKVGRVTAGVIQVITWWESKRLLDCEVSSGAVGRKVSNWKDQWLHSRKPNRGRERHLKSLARQAQVPNVTCFPLFYPSFYIYKWMESFHCEKYMGKRILASILSPENRKHLPFAG